MATKICPRCGAENDQKATYCVRCGTVLDAANAAPGPQATPGATNPATPAGAAPAQTPPAQNPEQAAPAQGANNHQPEPPQGAWQGAPQYTFGHRPPKAGAYPPPYGQPGPAPSGASSGPQGANPANAAQGAYSHPNPEPPRTSPQDAYQAGNPQYAYQPGQPPYPYPPREQHPFGQPDRIFGWYDGDFTPDAASPARSRVAGGVLAILLGLLGIHKFYLGQWGAGLICLLITLFFVWNVGWIVGLLFLYNLTEAILLFTMKPEEFQNKYHVRAE